MRRRQLLGTIAGLAAFPAARASQTGYRPLGSVEITGAAEAVVGDDGQTAYVAAETGFATVDISDPATPTVLTEHRDLLADREIGPMAGIIDVKTDGDRLIVPGPGHPTGEETVSGFLLYDVSDPTAPEQLAFHEVPSLIHNAYLSDGLVYLTQGSTVAIVDVSGEEPADMAEIDITEFESKWADVSFFLRRPHDVWVQNRTAYIPAWEAGTWIVDVSDPADPKFVGHVEARPFEEVSRISFEGAELESTEPPGNHHYAQPSADGRLLAIGKESWDADANDDTGGPSGIELWDISNLASPVMLSEIHPPRADDETRDGTWTTSHNFHLVGERLYTSWYQGGVKIHDISNPGRPEELVWWRDPEQAAFWTAVLATDEFFVASSSSGPGGSELTEALYTFPTEVAEQRDPPSSLAPARPPSEYATARPAVTPTPTPTATPTQSPTPSPTATPSPTHSPTPTETPGQPGFGALSGLAGLAAGFWWLIHDRDGPD